MDSNALASRHHNPVNTASMRRPRIWSAAGHFGIYLVVCLVLTYVESVSAVSDYRGSGGAHIWEPIVWSATSIFVIVALAYGVYYFCEAFPLTRERWLSQGLIHLGGSLVFSLVHFQAMFALREVIYALAGHDYKRDAFWEDFFYEYSKDIITYLSLVVLCHVVLLWRRMNQAQFKALSLEADLAQLQLRRLQEQLRPHFLFNTLNHISSCMYEDVEKADKLLSDLCNLLRYSLKKDQRLTVPLREELDFLNLYLGLMNQRFSGRIETEIHVPQPLMAAQVPRFILQPLVENAIQHGFRDRDGAGRIEIRAEKQDALLVLQVADDGKGMAFDGEEPVHGHGLGNIMGLLERRYPNVAQLELLPNAGGGLMVRITLPFSADGETQNVDTRAEAGEG